MWSSHSSRRATSQEKQVAQGDHEEPSASPGAAPATDESDQGGPLIRVAESYEALIQSVRPKLDDSDCAALDVTLKSIRERFPPGLLRQSGAPCPQLHASAAASSPTYLGKASDAHFLDSFASFVRAQEQQCGRKDESDGQFDEQSDVFEPSMCQKPLKLPPKETAFSYLDIYFSTIHIAYPFLSKPMILHHAKEIWDADPKGVDARPWLALLSKS